MTFLPAACSRLCVTADPFRGCGRAFGRRAARGASEEASRAGRPDRAKVRCRSMRIPSSPRPHTSLSCVRSNGKATLPIRNARTRRTAYGRHYAFQASGPQGAPRRVPCFHEGRGAFRRTCVREGSRIAPRACDRASRLRDCRSPKRRRSLCDQESLRLCIHLRVPSVTRQAPEGGPNAAARSGSGLSPTTHVASPRSQRPRRPL